jgi:hypothetical protein
MQAGWRWRSAAVSGFMRLQLKTTWAHRIQGILRPSSDRLVTSPPTSRLRVPPTADWDDAFLRVESYLRAHHIESRVLLNQLTSEILTAARRVVVDHPGQAPVTVAMHVAHARIGEWLVRALGEGDWTDERFRARGRLALLLAEVPQRRPELFLAPGEVPPEIRARLGAARLWPGPELRVASMGSSPLEFAIADAVEKKWETFSRSAFLHAAAVWILIAGAAGVAWMTIR